ncbi:hypothetical protein PTSG_09686 [Salpingoeca rosetta]|uniref:Exostosin GT47 domain-containing protein n=1 Tax=Salpingoeca rosetta (strain ATCC 50818 / BSB-021) TaxID=946362 RepID=F2UNR3_SALR5|nr:uncharacterized protein PTSG_09686 [Salpingoeca rosetta]EGD79268.1 hypothetical protein PTSG_09686 [Salpingoeca rosetta]|eukprot:XP_004989039.1 hypothetical protein PTSG_09686 [Salpingoeca rosetta]
MYSARALATVIGGLVASSPATASSTASLPLTQLPPPLCSSSAHQQQQQHTANTTTLGELLHSGCKWISGVAADTGLFLPRHSMQPRHPSSSSMQPQVREFHHCDSLDVSMPRFSMVTFIHSHRSSDAFHPHKQEIPRHLQGYYQVCSLSCHAQPPPQAAQRQRKSSNTELALETKFGLIVEGFGYHSFRCIMAAGAIPVIVVDHYVLVQCEMMSVGVKYFKMRLWMLPRILRSIPDEVVEIMRRRVVFVFEEFFKSLSTQVHTALESARINLFSGDNALQRALSQQLSPLPLPPTTTALVG